MMLALAARFEELFRGLDRAYSAVTGHGGSDDRGKIQAKYNTFREQLTDLEWKKHLKGEHGIVPVPIRDDGTITWGAIDVDEYDGLDLPALARRVSEMGLPLVLCRSKSGGAHLFLFLSQPEPAADMRALLEDYAAALGYAGTEIFPKQVQLSSENDVGNGIAAPYRGGDRSLEYALDDKGVALSPEEFVAYAEGLRKTAQELPEPPRDEVVDMDGAPPCLVRWAARGVGSGNRNDVAFDLALYCRQRWPDEWQDRFEAMAERVCRPPLPVTELAGIIKSVERRKTYSYRAKCQGPLCRPGACRKAEFGRKTEEAGADDPGVPIDGMTIVQTEPRTYIIRVDGRSVEVGSEALARQDIFWRAVLEQLDLAINRMRPKVWARLVKRLVETADKVDAPEDAGPRGTLRHHLQDFLDERLAQERERLRLGHAWFDPDQLRYYFRAKDLQSHLRRHRVAARERDIFNMVRAEGGDSDRIRAGRDVLRVWYIPGEPPEAPEPDPIPHVTPPEEDRHEQQ